MMTGNVSGALIFLVNTLLSLYAMVVLLRFILQMVRADFYNPLSQFVVRATNPLLRPLRKIIPGAWGIDFASLLLFYLVALVTVAALIALAGRQPPLLWVFYYGLLKCLVLTIHLYFFTIIVQVIMSWVSQGWNPVTALLYTINEPLLRPFRRILPSMGGLDLSPLFALILLQFVNYLIPLPGLLR